MSLAVCLALYCLLIIAASLIGGWVPLHVRLTHRRIQLANSVIGGFMLGVALLHMVPHAMMSVAYSPNTPSTLMAWAVGGVLTMFLLERFFHFHQHDLPSYPPPAEADAQAHHHHEHDGQACDDHTTQTPHYDHTPKLSWSGAAIGLVLHSLIAGVALGASMTAEQGVALPGLALFLVILFHKPFDSMTLLALVATSGWSRKTGHLINALFALAVPIGAGIFMLGAANEHDAHSQVVGCALAFSAGVFLCIALSDVLPELHFHQHDKIKLTAALILGLAIAWAISYFEMKHHDHHGRADDKPTSVASADAVEDAETLHTPPQT